MSFFNVKKITKELKNNNSKFNKFRNRQKPNFVTF